MNIWLKILMACIFSLLFLTAVGIVFSSINFFGGVENPVVIVFPLLIAFLACYGLSWINTRSFWKSFISALGGLIIGLPLSYLLFVPFGYWLAERLSPLSNLGPSGSLSGAWFFLGIVITIEALTDRLRINKRWLMMLIGMIVVMILIYGIELITARSGITGDKSAVKIAVYTPLIWTFIVGFANVRHFNR